MTFVGFLTGFVAVLCIGNYYRAKRAMERQKQKRIARLSGNAGNGIIGAESPGGGSSASSNISDEQQRLLGGGNNNVNMMMMNNSAGRRRRNDNSENLLLDLNSEPNVAQVTSI